MTILILVAVISLVLGPIMMMQPSQAQRRQARLREAASLCGLRVHLQPVPGTAHVGGALDMAAMYCLPWQEQQHSSASWLLTRRAYDHELHFDGRWEWQGSEVEENSQPLKAALKSVPGKVFALGRGPQGLCCYWSEFGEEADVEALAHWLKHELRLIVD